VGEWSVREGKTDASVTIRQDVVCHTVGPARGVAHCADDGAGHGPAGAGHIRPDRHIIRGQGGAVAGAPGTAASVPAGADRAHHRPARGVHYAIRSPGPVREAAVCATQNKV
jgi:hypothetical protein